MQISVLGPTQVHRPDGTPVPVGGARLRALLTALALRPGRTVPVGLLVDEVWNGDAPPADAVAALQALVGRLRRALGPGAVVSAPGGYRLDAAPDDVDAHRFERLAGEGVRSLEAGEPAKALRLLDEALALWRDPVLADLPDRTAEAARWETRRHGALRSRLTAVLALGRPEDALPELAALCDTAPLDEPLHALRIKALRAAGRPAEALAAYEAVRRHLAARLGTDPGPQLRALHTELLAPTPGPPSPTTPPPPPPPPPSAPATPPAIAPGTPPRTPTAPATAAPEAPAPAPRASGAPAPGASPVWAPPGPDAAAPVTPAAVPGAAGPAFPAAGPATPAAPATTPPGPDAAPSGESGPVGPVSAAPEPAGPVSATPGSGAAVPGAPVPAGPAPWGSAPASPAPRQGNLRARLTSFVGRGEDIGVILGDLGQARLVTLLGAGGAGKTRLSQEVAERGAARWPDGVWVAELAPVADPDAVTEAVLTALGARETVLRGAGAEELRAAEPRGNDPLVRLTEHCAARRMLLLLDNCEHVVTAAARLAEHLLEHCPGLTVLATSREPLAVGGEVVRPVEPLPDPMALRLLGERGAAARAGFVVHDDPDACAEICRRLDGLPLAIELAAARLRALTPRQIADRLDDRFRLLTSGSRTVLPRQQTLRAVVDWSWDLLDDQERAVLRRLSVFSGGCDLDAAEAVCDVGADTFDVLGSLVDKSLVVASPGDEGAMRFRLLETVGEYAGERLDQAGERRATEGRHLVHYRELARTSDPLLRGARQRAALGLLQREYENLRAALRRAVAARDEHEALCLVLSLTWYWQMRDLRTDARHWSDAAAALGPDPFAPPVTPAPPLTERCTDAPPPMRDDLLWEARREIRLVRTVNMDHEMADWTTEGRVLLDRFSQAYRPGLPQTCRMPGILWILAVLLSGDGDQLHTLLDTTVDTGRALGYDWDLAHALLWRANILANRSSQAAAACRDADESLDIFSRLGDSWGAAEALSARGEARENRGEYAGAAADYQAAVAHAERLDAQAQVSLLRTRYAAVLPELGRADEAEAILRAVLAEGCGAGHEAHPLARLHLSLQLGRTGRTAEARDLLRRLRDDFRSETLSLFDGFTLGCLAWLDNLDGHHDSALRLSAQALHRSRDPLSMMLAPQLTALHLVTAARAMTGLGGRARTAAVLLGAQEKQLPEGHVRSPVERENLTAAVAAARAALGDTAFDVAYAEGGGLTMEEAAALLEHP
ncbi:BTAD domain-containing putative transcriptional regulator [Streptomyces sp. TRM49041]|uniref:AfsR/SARP family transcriptional regulator n=1 Tax=Streptomyces sp. TRM49041 TaxID=2603216 RepID=UPI0011EC2D7E|nr:BTAD domain-containing putative transcriptional regulator [Streptomyces sp. TRM49041]